MPAPQPESAATTGVQSTSSTNVIAMLETLRQARALLAGCHDLLFAELECAPDDLLREATNDIFDIREIAGEIYEPIAFQIAENELAEIEAEEAAGTPPAETASQLTAGPPDGGAVNIFGDPVPSESAVNAADARDQAEALLKMAYASLMKRIRNRGREKSREAPWRAGLLADVRARVATMSDEDRRHLEQLESRYRDRAMKLEEQVNVMLKFWDLPAIGDEGQLQMKGTR